MASWSEVEGAVPELAAKVQARFEATGLGLMATLRADGAPRISGIEPLFALGEVWLGMMNASRKAFDLRRDSRVAIHSATADKEVKDGDAKIGGRALELHDDREFERFGAEFQAKTGYGPPGPYHLFRIDVIDISFLRPAGDHLDIEWWHEGGPPHRIERR